MDRTISINDSQNSCHYYLNIRLSDGENLEKIFGVSELKNWKL
jgi:hypothetical protein